MSKIVRTRICKGCKKYIEWVRCRVRCRDCHIEYCRKLGNECDEGVTGLWGYGILKGSEKI